MSIKPFSQCNLDLKYGAKEIGCKSPGIFVVIPESGYKPFAFSMDNMLFNDTTGRFNVEQGGYHKVFVRDSMNCVDSIELYFHHVDSLRIDNFTIQRFCNTNNYSVIYNVSGGTPPYYYINYHLVQTMVQTTPDLYLSPSPAYNTSDSLFVWDSKGCVSPKKKPLVAPPPILTIPDLCVKLDTLSEPNCSSLCGGMVKINCVNGNPPFTYSILPAATIQGDTISNLCGRTNYTLTVTSSYPATTITTNIYLGNNSSPFSYSYISSNCMAPNGNFSLRPGYSIHSLYRSRVQNKDWYQIGNNATNLEGNYYYKLIYLYNSDCIDSNIFYINSIPNNMLSTSVASHVSPTHINANNGEINILQPFAHTYVLIEKSSGVEFRNSTGHFKGLKIGYYNISTFDSLGCQTSRLNDYFLPLNSLNISVLNQSNVSCHGDCNGSITVKATGIDTNFTYSISPITVCLPTQTIPGTFVNLSSTSYTIIATDGTGATIPIHFSIAQPPYLFLHLTGGNDPSCNSCNGALVVNTQGGIPPYTYSLLPNSGTQATPGNFTNLCPGNYTVIVTDVNGCSDSNKYSLNIYQPLYGFHQIINPINCINDSSGKIKLTAFGGTPPYTYSINPPASISNNDSSLFIGLTENSYTLSISDINSCTFTGIATLSKSYPNIISTQIINNINCINDSSGQIKLTAVGGAPPYTYSIHPPASISNNDSSLFVGLTENIYTLFVSDNNSCSDTSIVILSKIYPNIFSTQIINNINCINDSSGQIKLTAVGGAPPYTYSIHPPASISNNDSSLFVGLTENIYTLSVSDNNSCSDTSIVILSKIYPSIINTQIINNINCINDSSGQIKLTASGGVPPYSYSINPPASISNNDSSLFVGLTANIYTLSVSDNNSCTDTSIVTLSRIYPQIDSVKGIPESCEPGYDGRIIIHTSNSPLIQKYSLDKVNWVDSSSFLNYPKGDYKVYVINSVGCMDSAQVSIPFKNDLKIKDFSFFSLKCNGDNSGSLILPIDSNQYTLQPSVSNFSNLTAGVYTLTAYTPRGCSGDTIFQISEPPLLTLNANILNNTYGDCHGEVQVSAQGGTPPYTFLVEPNNFVSISDSGILNYLCNTQYEVMVRDKHGCEKRQQIFIPYQDLDGDDFAIYPNPTQQEFNFIFSRKVDVVITLLDISGRIVHHEVYVEKDKVNLPVTHLANGFYITNLNFDGQLFVRKLEVRH